MAVMRRTIGRQAASADVRPQLDGCPVTGYRASRVAISSGSGVSGQAWSGSRLADRTGSKPPSCVQVDDDQHEQAGCHRRGVGSMRDAHQAGKESGRAEGRDYAAEPVEHPLTEGPRERAHRVIDSDRPVAGRSSTPAIKAVSAPLNWPFRICQPRSSARRQDVGWRERRLGHAQRHWFDAERMVAFPDWPIIQCVC